MSQIKPTKQEIMIYLTESIIEQLDGSILPKSVLNYLERNSYKLKGVNEVCRTRIRKKGVYTDELLIVLSDDTLVQIESTQNEYPQ